MAYYIGQFCGLLTTACSLFMPFLKKKWQLLCANIAINALVILNLVLIGQFGSGSYLCMVAIVQSVIALFRVKKETEVSTKETIIFTILYVGFGFFGIFTAPGFVMAVNFKNLLELLPILGALAQMVSVFVRDEQATRKWILCNAIFWVIYSGFVGSTVVITDSLTAISCCTALYKYRKNKPKKTAP